MCCIKKEINYDENNNVFTINKAVDTMHSALQRIKLQTYLNENNQWNSTCNTVLTRLCVDGAYYTANVQLHIQQSMKVTPLFSAYYDDNHNCERGLVYLRKNNENYCKFLNLTKEIIKTVKTPKQQSLIQSYMDKEHKKFYVMKLTFEVKK